MGTPAVKRWSRGDLQRGRLSAGGAVRSPVPPGRNAQAPVSPFLTRGLAVASGDEVFDRHGVNHLW